MGAELRLTGRGLLYWALSTGSEEERGLWLTIIPWWNAVSVGETLPSAKGGLLGEEAGPSSLILQKGKALLWRSALFIPSLGQGEEGCGVGSTQEEEKCK